MDAFVWESISYSLKDPSWAVGTETVDVNGTGARGIHSRLLGEVASIN